MQSTGHSSMHALSFTSTQVSAITYVTKVSSDLLFGVRFQLSGASSPSVLLTVSVVRPASSRPGCPRVLRRHVSGCCSGFRLLILAVAYTLAHPARRCQPG